jgi:3-hydroxyacyl-[acyl-carrier-protein] dehydratase
MNKIQTHEQKRGISLSAATTMRLLPQAYPFVLLDRVRACYPQEGIGYSIKNITMTDPVLSGHFPGYPIYPGVLIIEAMIQNACVIPTTRDLLAHCAVLKTRSYDSRRGEQILPGRKPR